MLKAIVLSLVLLLCSDAHAQQEKKGSRGTPEQCAALAENIRKLKEGLAELKATGIEGEELRKKQEPFDVRLKLNENLFQAVCN